MKFPWSKREKRSYTDAVIAASLAAAASEETLNLDIAALEIVRGWWGRAFASAALEPTASAGVAALTPSILNTIGRDLALHGESVLEIEVDGGAVMLTPVSVFEVRGGARRSSWTYDVEHAGPDGIEARSLPWARVVHAQYGYDVRRPWCGVGPLATLTATVAARLEQSLAHESGGAVGSVIPTPPGEKGKLQEDIRKLRGKLVLVDSMSSGWDTGTAGAPKGDWDVKRLGPTFTPNTEPVRESVAASILAAAGISPSVLGRSDGTLLREAFRQFTTSTIMPIAKIITPELEAKLDVSGLRFDFRELGGIDIAGRSKAFAAMTGAGLTPDVAMEIAGLVDA